MADNDKPIIFGKELDTKLRELVAQGKLVEAQGLMLDEIERLANLKKANDPRQSHTADPRQAHTGRKDSKPL